MSKLIHLCWCCGGRAFLGGECRTCNGVCRTCNGTGDLDKIQKPKRKAVAVRGFNDEEYEALKADLKKALDFKFTVRRWKRNYAPNAIDIRPTKAQNYKFTPEQVDKIYEFLLRRGYVISGKTLDEYYKHRHWIFSDGFNFVMQEV